MSILIKNAYILDMVGEEPNIKISDIYIEENRIANIAQNINIDCDEIIDGTGKLVMPGLVNTHTHLPMSIFKGYKDDRTLMDWLNNAIFPVEDKLESDDFYYNSEENNNNEESKRNDNENKNEKIFKFEGDENENKFGI